MRAVSVFMDLEDPINPLADDAALDFSRLFSECGVRGCFCVTGEKCRALARRGREDVIEALRPHCLGLHTDTHSVHPTTMELLADVSFEEGCALAYGAERKGVSAFVEVFGRLPAFWGGAGNTWSPEVTDALKRLGIPAYVYALTGSEPHRLNGVVGLPQHLSIGEDRWASGPVEVPALTRPWTAIFVGHPTRFRHEEFWDKSYAFGATPSEPATVEPVPEEHYEQAKSSLREFLVKLRAGSEVIGVNELLPRLSIRPGTASETVAFVEHAAASLRQAAGWLIHGPDLNAEGIVRKTHDLRGTFEVGLFRATDRFSRRQAT